MSAHALLRARSAAAQGPVGTRLRSTPQQNRSSGGVRRRERHAARCRSSDDARRQPRERQHGGWSNSLRAQQQLTQAAGGTAL
jgi:hypothetical protein